MKATLTTTFNETQLKEILNSLTIADCKRAVSFLQKRISTSEESKRLKTEGLRIWDDDFLNMRIDEFDLPTRILNRLRENKLNTVRDITNLGVDRLAMFYRIGERTAEEIKREIFNKPS